MGKDLWKRLVLNLERNWVLERNGKKKDVQMISKGLDVALAKVFLERGRLFERMGQFVGKNGHKFYGQIDICERSTER